MPGYKYRMPEDIRGAVVFDPTCVELGTSIIDWGSFGFGNTVLVDPMPLCVTTHAVEKAARAWGKRLGYETNIRHVKDEDVRDLSRPRAKNELRLAVCFTRASMVDISASQSEWAGIVERQQ